MYWGYGVKDVLEREIDSSDWLGVMYSLALIGGDTRRALQFYGSHYLSPNDQAVLFLLIEGVHV